MSYFSGLQDIFTEQRDLFLKKLNADFEVMQKMIERKRSELQDKICTAYDGHVQKTQNFSEGLGSLQTILSQINRADIKVDLDQINLNKAIKLRLKEIENELDFQVQGNELDLINSRFVNDPFPQLERCLASFSFFPVQQQRIVDMQNMFSASRILKPEHIDVDFLTEIVPPGLAKVRLLYQHSAEAILGKRDFERWEHLQGKHPQETTPNGQRSGQGNKGRQ